MDFIYRLIDAVAGFIRRNPLLCLLILFLALLSPQLLAGALKMVLYVVLFFVLLALAVAAMLGYRLHRLRRDVEEQMRGSNPFGGNAGSTGSGPREGEVSVQQTQPQEKKINSDVGDYVDFEEVDDRK